MIPWLSDTDPFPNPHLAMDTPNGLLCASLALSPIALLDAYTQGIFPWFSEGEPVLWWSPNPRMVLFPEEFKISRSLQKTLDTSKAEISFDRDFEAVITACAKSPRKGQKGTWIDDKIKAAYAVLFEAGFAHTVEVRNEGHLIGGLYGVALGKMFYGESMFHSEKDASKIALAHLVRFLKAQGFGMLDCQVKTQHLASLGAREISRDVFLRQLKQLMGHAPQGMRWQASLCLASDEAGGAGCPQAMA